MAANVGRVGFHAPAQRGAFRPERATAGARSPTIRAREWRSYRWAGPRRRIVPIRPIPCPSRAEKRSRDGIVLRSTAPRRLRHTEVNSGRRGNGEAIIVVEHQGGSADDAQAPSQQFSGGNHTIHFNMVLLQFS